MVDTDKNIKFKRSDILKKRQKGMKINEENWLSLTIDNLMLLESAFIDGEITTMTFDGDTDDKIDELKRLVKYLNKTN